MHTENEEKTDGSDTENDALDRMLKLDYNPSEIVIELAKCILGMLHYRVLSWAQFKVSTILNIFS